MRLHQRVLSIIALVLVMTPPVWAQEIERRSTPAIGDSAQHAGAVVRRRPPTVPHGTSLPFVRTELFFGTAKPGGVVTAEEFRAFLDAVITPLFPDGLTLLQAYGQFRGDDGVVIKETSYELILLYPYEDRASGDRKIERIRSEYLRQHQQESVLRVDDSYVTWVRF